MSGAGSVLQMVLSLAAVVAMILGLAWITRRMQGLRGVHNAELKVRATLAVGAKERVVLIEACGQRLLIGVAVGQVSLLARIDAANGALSSDNDQNNETVMPAKAGIESPFVQRNDELDSRLRGNDGCEIQVASDDKPSTSRRQPGMPFSSAFAHQLNQLLGR